MSEEIELLYSDLQTRFSKDGQTVEIKIYRTPDTDWTLEVVDSGNNSTVWEDTFPTDEAALAEGLQAIKDEGILAFVRVER